PNHIHFIVIANDNNGSSGTPTPTNMVIPKLISTFKRFVNKKVGKQIWQRGYYDHIIRNSIDYERIWQYIDTNPIKWELDEYYTD
ncbi:MAG: transposase, partial [Clostridia bacterium]|nr:transposase [Clostridia bacterium]